MWWSIAEAGAQWLFGYVVALGGGIRILLDWVICDLDLPELQLLLAATYPICTHHDRDLP